MSRKGDEKEVSVKPPGIIRFEEPDVIRDTIEAERVRVFTVTKKVGECISGLMIATSVLILFASFLYLFDPPLGLWGLPSVKSLLTPNWLIVITGIVAVINILCGLVMLAKD
ncbi:MAG: hypothetical protein ACE5NN_00270 [Candidatus Bathyarchaeia archaeon]